ncbi:MAG: hypothetical protein JNJ49_05695 [Bdellovibrionaceae bacterium]|nr:hypothetical protein [Pseudobdellovibrionaceae bacterium]
MLSKMTLSALALSLISVAAQANDGGVAYVDVQGINPVTKSSTGEVIKVKDGSVITVYGKDAEKFMRLLPTDATVVDGMVTPAESELRRQNQRSLALVSDGWTLFFNCSAAEIQIGNNDKATVTKLPQTTCQISLNKNTSPEFKYDMLGDAFKLDMNDKTQRTCQ